MKILLINDSCKEVGGAETYIFAISKLLKKNHEVFLYSFADTEENENNRRIIPHSKGLTQQFNRFFFNFQAYSQLRKYIQKVKPDIVFMHNNYVYSNSVLLALKKEKIPVLQTVHDWGLFCPSSWCVIKKNFKRCNGYEGSSINCLLNGCVQPHHFFLGYLRNKIRIKLTKKTIKHFVSPSKMLAEDLVKHKFPSVQCIHNFMEFDTKEIDLKSSEKGLILYVGVLSKNKGVEFLIKAFKEVIK